jgi:hypothetical protein
MFVLFTFIIPSRERDARTEVVENAVSASPASRARICWLPEPTVSFAFSTPPLNPDSGISQLYSFLKKDQQRVVSLCGAVGNPESSEGFPNGCWNRGVCGAISKARWETCGKVASLRSQLSIKSSTGPAPVAASTGLRAKLGFHPQILRKTPKLFGLRDK